LSLLLIHAIIPASCTINVQAISLVNANSQRVYKQLLSSFKSLKSLKSKQGLELALQDQGKVGGVLRVGLAIM